jgi:hypothetical protein
MRNVLVKLAATVGVIAPVATAGVVPAGALGVYFGQPHHGYYSYHGSALKCGMAADQAGSVSVTFVSPISGPVEHYQ